MSQRPPTGRVMRMIEPSQSHLRPAFAPRAGTPGGRPDGDTAVLDAVDTDQQHQPPWNVLLYNDDFHTFDEVIIQLQKAVGCSLEVAEHITRVADSEGKAVAYTGDKQDCERVAGILSQIHLIVAVVEAE